MMVHTEVQRAIHAAGLQDGCYVVENHDVAGSLGCLAMMAEGGIPATSISPDLFTQVKTKNYFLFQYDQFMQYHKYLEFDSIVRSNNKSSSVGRFFV